MCIFILKLSIYGRGAERIQSARDIAEPLALPAFQPLKFVVNFYILLVLKSTYVGDRLRESTLSALGDLALVVSALS